MIALPPEVGYFSIESNGKTIGASGYSLSISQMGWDFSCWTLIFARTGAQSGAELLRLFASAELDPAMRLKEYSLKIGDDTQVKAKYSDGVLTVVSTKREQIDVEKIRDEDVRAEAQSMKGDVKTIVETTLVAEVDSAPFILDVNVFPLWSIISKQVNLRSGSSLSSFGVIVPQLAKLGEITATVGHSEKYEGRTVYRIAFSGLGFDAVAMADSLNSRIHRLEMQGSGITLRYSPQCPDTSSFTAIDLLEEIKLKAPESKIKCDKLIEQPLKVKYLKASIDIEVDATPKVRTSWQKFDGVYRGGRVSGTAEVKMKTYRGSRSWKFENLAGLPEELYEYLKTEPDIPARNEMIKSLSERFRKGDDQLLWDYVCDANRWVADNVKQEANQQDALVAAARRRGDPLARARLLAAMLRTVRIPARVVGGIYYFGQIWLPHYWVEVWVSPAVGWRPVDPSTGEDENFSAVHIALFENEGKIGAGDVSVVKAK